MIEKGKVLRIEGEEAVVLFEAEENCQSCCSKEICRMAENDLRYIRAVNGAGAVENDLVEIEIPSSSVLKKAFVLYILPAVFFVGGMGFSLFAGLTEVLSFFVGLVCLAVFFTGLAVFDKFFYAKKYIRPQIIKILKFPSLERSG